MTESMGGDVEPPPTRPSGGPAAHSALTGGHVCDVRQPTDHRGFSGFILNLQEPLQSECRGATDNDLAQGLYAYRFMNSLNI